MQPNTVTASSIQQPPPRPPQQLQQPPPPLMLSNNLVQQLSTSSIPISEALQSPRFTNYPSPHYPTAPMQLPASPAAWSTPNTGYTTSQTAQAAIMQAFLTNQSLPTQPLTPASSPASVPSGMNADLSTPSLRVTTQTTANKAVTVETHQLTPTTLTDQEATSSSDRIFELEKEIRDFVTYGLACDEFFDWLDTPAAYEAQYEDTLFHCATAVREKYAEYGLWTGLRVWDKLHSIRQRLPSKVQAMIVEWQNELEAKNCLPANAVTHTKPSTTTTTQSSSPHAPVLTQTTSLPLENSPSLQSPQSFIQPPSSQSFPITSQAFHVAAQPHTFRQPPQSPHQTQFAAGLPTQPAQNIPSDLNSSNPYLQGSTQNQSMLQPSIPLTSMATSLSGPIPAALPVSLPSSVAPSIVALPQLSLPPGAVRLNHPQLLQLQMQQWKLMQQQQHHQHLQQRQHQQQQQQQMQHQLQLQMQKKLQQQFLQQQQLQEQQLIRQQQQQPPNSQQQQVQVQQNRAVYISPMPSWSSSVPLSSVADVNGNQSAPSAQSTAVVQQRKPTVMPATMQWFTPDGLPLALPNVALPVAQAPLVTPQLMRHIESPLNGFRLKHQQIRTDCTFFLGAEDYRRLYHGTPVQVPQDSEKWPITYMLTSWKINSYKTKCEWPLAVAIEINNVKPQMERSYYFAIDCYSRETEDHVTQKVLKGTPIDASVSRGIINDRLSTRRIGAAQQGDDDEIEVVQSSYRINLKCPISMQRISQPIRGIRCKHADCYDLSSYLAVNHGNAGWTCPHCSCYTPIQTLARDLFFEYLLATVPKNVYEIEFSQSSNEWVATKTELPDPDEPYSDEENDQLPIKNENASPQLAQVTVAQTENVINLISDDEEEGEEQGGEKTSQPQLIRQKRPAPLPSPDGTLVEDPGFDSRSASTEKDVVYHKRSRSQYSFPSYPSGSPIPTITPILPTSDNPDLSSLRPSDPTTNL
ncbi:uncharacterized protein BYT42DRAFT_547707 [Radiomyces spectabilis]|uniref:uncharacterized protein n=1 Tax=Radiomyces spectabilis TaxID=64574 RepID=UPI00221F4B47|nr:uncharacterized protein BYT42DRAFT_547707 [Radiomyces spectabilis]KAI8374712.1 hypothetical protein BYT42DRAFT_547707 [Radiomyces spectabilis]